ncbi:hypothetical protein SUGI_0332530 [Cryptomeria japonica]|nr:hypothetical protein SUGI_0332530 [Cryptomeria japonica]
MTSSRRSQAQQLPWCLPRLRNPRQNYVVSYCTGLLFARRVLKQLMMDDEYVGQYEEVAWEEQLKREQSTRRDAKMDKGNAREVLGWSMAAWQHDRVEIIANDQGNRTTPSYVVFIDTERPIGEAAKNQVAMNPNNTVSDASYLKLLSCLSLKAANYY